MREVRLEFPGWAPKPVIQIACSLWAKAESRRDTHPEEAQTIQEVQTAVLRLAGDPRMREVWKTLRRKDCRVIAPAVWQAWLKIFGEMPPEHGPQTADDIGLAVFFQRVALLAMCNTLGGTATAKPPPSLADQLRFKADLLDITEGRMPEGHVGLPNDLNVDVFDILINMHMPAVIQRRRGKEGARIATTLLAKVTEKMFGKVMCTTVASTVNAALDLKGKHEISLQDVKNWCRRD
jgi:hypothetical protein